MDRISPKKQLENMMETPLPQKRVSIVRLCMVKDSCGLYGMERLSGPGQAVGMVRPLLMMADREIMVVMSLSVSLEPLAVEIAAVGGLAACQVDIRNIFKHALLGNADSVICFHNHPFGKPDPSREDRLVTERISRAGEVLGITLLDHIIIGKDGFYSFKENGGLGQDKDGYDA